MTCLVTMLAREEWRLSHIFCNTDEADPAHNDACEAMEVCRLIASWAPAPKTEEGWAFLAYVLAWYEGDRDSFALRSRISKTLSARRDNWLVAAYPALAAA
jgi:hypothetical protein